MKQGILRKGFQRESLNSPHFYPQFLFQPQIPVSSIAGKFARMWQLLPQHTLVKVYEVQTDVPPPQQLVVSHMGQPMLYSICQ